MILKHKTEQWCLYSHPQVSSGLSPHLVIEIFAHSVRPQCFSSFELDWGHFSNIWIKPDILIWTELWTLTWPFQDIRFSLTHSSVALIVCPDEAPAHLKQGSFKNYLYFALFIVPLTPTSFLVTADENQPHSMILPPPCFAVGMVFSAWCKAPGLLQLLCWGWF